MAKKLMRLSSSQRETLSNEKVLATDRCTNANQVIVELAKTLGIDNIFVLNDDDRPSLTTVGGNQLLEALESSLTLE